MMRLRSRFSLSARRSLYVMSGFITSRSGADGGFSHVVKCARTSGGGIHCITSLRVRALRIAAKSRITRCSLHTGLPATSCSSSKPSTSMSPARTHGHLWDVPSYGRGETLGLCGTRGCVWVCAAVTEPETLGPVRHPWNRHPHGGEGGRVTLCGRGLCRRGVVWGAAIGCMAHHTGAGGGRSRMGASDGSLGNAACKNECKCGALHHTSLQALRQRRHPCMHACMHARKRLFPP
eukprot:39421-Chlamydomonas_euryale.AAC.1